MNDPQPYSKVARSMWGDQKFKALTERSKFLWLYLLTGPHCTSIPGILPNVGIGTIADALKWPAGRVRKQFWEIETADMAIADWSANVIVLPNAILYNDPSNPNVILSWRKIPLPQCDLVVRALRAIRIVLNSKEDPAPWVDAFDEAFRKGFPEGFLKPSGGTFGKSGSGTETRDQDQGTGSGSGPRPTTTRVETVGTVENHPPARLAITAQDRNDAIAHRRLNPCPHHPQCGSINECLEQLTAAIAIRRFQSRSFAN